MSGIRDITLGVQVVVEVINIKQIFPALFIGLFVAWRVGGGAKLRWRRGRDQDPPEAGSGGAADLGDVVGQRRHVRRRRPNRGQRPHAFDRPGCGGVGMSPTPVLYHDMDKKLMIYVMPEANEEELQEGKRDVEESLKESTKGRKPQHNFYVLDSMDDLQDIVIRLESAQYADGSFPDDLGPEDWKYLVDTIIAPERPWPLDHKCICGEEIRTVCLCTRKGVYIDLGCYEPNVPGDLVVQCPECDRGLLGFTCEKCNSMYNWQIGVVDNISE